MLDVFFISIGEANAEDNWKKLIQLRPDAKRVQDVKGIYEVHKTCAKISTTENFWVVDADAWVLNDFDFTWTPDPNVRHWNVAEPDCVLIWRSRNPVNDLEYGYGGVKMFPRQPFLEDRAWHIDLSTTIGSVTVIKDQLSCETRFNATPESAWIGGFRECAKLASLTSVCGRIQRKQQRMMEELEELERYIATQDWTAEQRTAYRKGKKAVIIDSYKYETNIYNYFGDIETATDRYSAWSRYGWHRYNGQYAVLGAQAGVKYGLKNANNLPAMNQINDWNWLKQEFKKHVNV